MMRFADDQINESYLATVGVDFRFKTLDINGDSTKI
jgi:Ras-related protein Rab-1A